MRKMNIIFVFAIVLLLGNKCDKEREECHKTISFINNSDNAVYVYSDGNYPDTLHFGTYSGLASNANFYKILSKMSNDRPLKNRDCWEDVFNYGVQIPSDTLMVYVFDAELLESIPWSTIVHNYMVLKRYDLTIQDLRKMNWTITYP